MNDDTQALMARIASLRAQLAVTTSEPKAMPRLQHSHSFRTLKPLQKRGTFRNRTLLLPAAEEPTATTAAPVVVAVAENKAIEPILTYSATKQKRKTDSGAVSRKRRKVTKSQLRAQSTSFFQRQLVRIGDANYRRHVAPSGNRSLVAARPAPPNSANIIRTAHSLRLALPVSPKKPVAPLAVPVPDPLVDSPSSMVARARTILQLATKQSQSHRSKAPASNNGANNIVRDFRQPCIFFVRFGECKLGAKCRYAHPHDKVAVCRAFLRGNCALGAEKCKLSHSVAPEKMPTCRHFLKGRCTKGSRCEYRHVRVADDAPVCDEFLKGWCALGLQCTKHHTYECVSFARHGKCERGDDCRLLHVVDTEDDDVDATAAAAADDVAKKPKTTKKRKVAREVPTKRHAVDIVDSSSTAPILIALRNSFAEDEVGLNDDEPQSISFHRRAD